MECLRPNNFSLLENWHRGYFLGKRRLLDASLTHLRLDSTSLGASRPKSDWYWLKTSRCAKLASYRTQGSLPLLSDTLPDLKMDDSL